MPHVSRINIHPIKALDGFAAAEARVLRSGALEHDREWAIIAAPSGEIVNGRRTPRVHGLRATYDEAVRHVTLNGTTFRLGDAPLDAFLSDWFQEKVALRHFPQGTPDHLKRTPGPSVVSTATLEQVADWLQLSVDEVRRRFRLTIEIGGVPPFWEDQLVRTRHAVEFRIGAVRMSGIEHCARCVVPPRNPETGESIRGFQKLFLTRRRDTLPGWSDRGAFPHFYHLGVLTRAYGEGRSIRTGDEVIIAGVGSRQSILAPLRRLRRRLTFRPD